MAILFPIEYPSSLDGLIRRFAKNTIVRYRKNIVNAEHIALKALTATAACMLSENIVKSLAKSWNTGFPGG